MVFTENQATQFYVATEVKTEKLTKDSKAGEVRVGTTKKGEKYLQVKGATTLLRSALIDPKTVMQVKGTKAADMQRPLRKATVTLKKDVNGGAPIPSQDYTIHIIVRQYQGISDEQTLVKTAAVHAYPNMTAEQFYNKMKDSLELNFKRELNTLFKFEASAEGLVITEVEQDWMLGTYEQVPVYFDVFTTSVYLQGDEVNWGDVKYADSDTKIGNGKKIADMEYFFMGERGDQYRQIGWPNYIPTKYLVDPQKEYNTLNIHFAYVGSNESIQKSEQDIMVVSTDASVIDAIGEDIAKAAGITYDKIAG